MDGLPFTGLLTMDRSACNHWVFNSGVRETRKRVKIGVHYMGVYYMFKLQHGGGQRS